MAAAVEAAVAALVVVAEAAVAATLPAAGCHAAASLVAEWPWAARVGTVLILTVLAILTVPAIGTAAT